MVIILRQSYVLQEVEAVAAELTAARQQAHEKATEKSSEHWQSIIVSNMQAHKKVTPLHCPSHICRLHCHHFMQEPRLFLK